LARRHEVPAASILQSAAVERLRPDLGERMLSGELTFEDVRGDVVAAFWELVNREASA